MGLALTDIGGIDFATATTVRADPDLRWHVLQTKPRQEKMLARDLVAMGAAHFLPLNRRTTVSARRRLQSELPLFPGYLFLHGSLDDAYRADRTKRVARIIPVHDQKQFEWEILNLRLAIDGQATLDPYPALRSGVRVEVRCGPFEGLQGIVEDRVGYDRLILQVAMLGQAVSLEIDPSLLEPLD